MTPLPGKFVPTPGNVLIACFVNVKRMWLSLIAAFMQYAYAVIANHYGRSGDRMSWSLKSHLQLTYARDWDHTKT
jgi:hypothetical protein